MRLNRQMDKHKYATTSGVANLCFYVRWNALTNAALSKPLLLPRLLPPPQPAKTIGATTISSTSAVSNASTQRSFAIIFCAFLDNKIQTNDTTVVDRAQDVFQSATTGGAAASRNGYVPDMRERPGRIC